MRRQENNRCLYGFAHRPEYSGRIINVYPSLFSALDFLEQQKTSLIHKMVNHFSVTGERAKEKEKERAKYNLDIIQPYFPLSLSLAFGKSSPS